MVNFGVFWFGAYLALVIALLVCLLRAASKATHKSKPMYAGLLLFGFYFAIGSLNLPFPIIFPINALFFLFFFLVAFRKIAADDRVTARSRKLDLAESLSKASGE
jgi:uncharacterized membrane protein